jgi:ribonucleoside-diphosphate reductase alpha chain
MELTQWLGENNTLGCDIFNNKYRHNNETLDEFFERVSCGNNELKKLIKQNKFMFGGRILANRGLQNKGKKISYSNCYVISPPEDNIEIIFDVAKKLSRTYSYGGGCGVDISKLRPVNSKVNNAAKTTSGATSFMDLYSLCTELIAQHGRRGALMISLSCSHPELLEFLDIKNDLNKVTKANISVRLTNDFMKSAMDDLDYWLEFIVPETNETIKKKVNAKDTLMKLAENNWNVGEPGALFWDSITSWNIVSNDENFEYAGVNPCAEEPLPAGGSCLLGSLNLSEFIINPFTKQAKFDYDSFGQAIRTAVKALNEVMHEGIPLHPLKEQQQSVNDWRQIGLGCFGWHDALIKLGLKYGEKESLELANQIGYELKNTALEASSDYVAIFGTYPKYNKKAVLASPYIKDSNSTVLNKIEKYGLANSQILTIPPTGSIANMLGVSNALEPIYNISYTRKTESLHGKDEYYKIYTPIVEQYMKANGITEESDLPDIFVTAMTLDWKKRIDMQSTWQQYIDASISSTVNLPESATKKDIFDLYIYAWQKGLKGITVFRDNCKRVGVLTNTKSEDNDFEEVAYDDLPRGFIEKVPCDLTYRKYKLKTGCGFLYLFIGVDDDGKIYDCFTNTDGVGGCAISTQANSRLLSAAQLEKAGNCPSFSYHRGKGEKLADGRSCPSAIAHVLKRILQEFKDEEIEEKKQYTIINPCPDCGQELHFEAGCNMCKNCGWSKCS